MNKWRWGMVGGGGFRSTHFSQVAWLVTGKCNGASSNGINHSSNMCMHTLTHSLTHWKHASFAYEWHHHKVWRDVLAVEEDAGGWEAVKEKTLLTLLIASIRQLWPHWLTFQDRIHLMHPKNQRQWPQLIRYQCFSLDPLIFQPSALLLYYISCW